MGKKSVKRWSGMIPGKGVRLVGKRGWVLRDGVPTPGVVLINDGEGEVLISFDHDILKGTGVFGSKRDLLKACQSNP